ncbi:methyltransferase family protein [Actinomycetospora cinnamomea]|uniref:Methyltransferase family protein n=2 Tax=Actinomycetospora cinnamomea TaxID=663609 RepID=A0A2U1EYE4_9PSEU|nr:methyltransferase family protein [Actinomycetospora cinnamomea]
MPDVYDRCLADAVFRPFAVDVARRAARLRPSRVVEVAAGTGVATAELLAATPEAHLTATDLNPAMVEAGEERVAAAAWQRADASSLPFDDGVFDLVVCQFGVMFFPDRPAAYSEFRRVLAPSGHVLVNTWDRIDTHGFARVLVEGLERALTGDVPAFLAQVPHGYADPQVVVGDLRGAGLEVESVETVTLEGRAASAADVATGFCTGTPLRGEIEARGDLDETTRLVAAHMTAVLGEGPVSAAMTAHVVQARR